MTTIPVDYWRAFEDEDTAIDTFTKPIDAALAFLEDVGDLPDRSGPDRNVLVIGYKETNEPPPAAIAEDMRVTGWKPGQSWFKRVAECTVWAELRAYSNEPTPVDP